MKKIPLVFGRFFGFWGAQTDSLLLCIPFCLLVFRRIAESALRIGLRRVGIEPYENSSFILLDASHPLKNQIVLASSTLSLSWERFCRLQQNCFPRPRVSPSISRPEIRRQTLNGRSRMRSSRTYGYALGGGCFRSRLRDSLREAPGNLPWQSNRRSPSSKFPACRRDRL